MSLNEVDKLKVLQEIDRGKISQVAGAKCLGITDRHMRRIYKCFRRDGPTSVVSKQRGRISNNRISDHVREAVLATIKAQYHGFGATLVHEKLTEIHQFKIGVESVRKLMIAAGLKQAKQRRRINPHQMRARRPQRGELIQIDGSPHAWFEERAPKCCLLLAIDDATGEVMAARFVETESMEGYFALMEDYLSRHGRPLALYSDKHGIFRVNTKEAESGTGETQFARAMRELDIEIICANSPQAKGRVERMNQTLQDRMIKEMRLAGVNDMAAGNAFLKGYLPILKQKFAVPAASPIDAHRTALPSQEALDLILSIQHIRKLSKALELQYNNITYQVQVKNPSYAMRGASVRVCERHGKVTLLFKGKELHYTIFDKKNQPQPIISSKDINLQFDKRTLGNKPAEDHPWKRNYPQNNVAVNFEHLPTASPKQSDSYLSPALADYG